MRAGFNKLTCLALYGENIHPLALGALVGLPSLCSLDVRGMRQLSDSTSVGPVLASLASLEHLDLGDTSLGDGIVESLTYGRRVANWSRQSRHPENADWQVQDIPQEPVGECKLPHAEYLQGQKYKAAYLACRLALTRENVFHSLIQV